jgi:hypothetical protein
MDDIFIDQKESRRHISLKWYIYMLRRQKLGGVNFLKVRIFPYKWRNYKNEIFYGTFAHDKPRVDIIEFEAH